MFLLIILLAFVTRCVCVLPPVIVCVRARVCVCCVRVCQGFHCKHNMMYTMPTSISLSVLLSPLSLSPIRALPTSLQSSLKSCIYANYIIFYYNFLARTPQKAQQLAKLCQLSNFRFELALPFTLSLPLFRWVGAAKSTRLLATLVSRFALFRDSFAHFVQHPRGKRLCPGDSRPATLCTLCTGLCGCLSTNAHRFNCCSVMSLSSKSANVERKKNTHSISVSISLSISRSEIKVQNIFQYVNKLWKKNKNKLEKNKKLNYFGQKKRRSWPERAAAAECGQANALNS